MTTRALIIDDDEALAEMLSEFLKARDLEVVTRYRADTGLAALEEETFDAVILDVMLPTSTDSKSVNGSGSVRISLS